MRFQKANQGGKQVWVGGAAPQLLCPDSGQVEEALRPAALSERCRKRGKGERVGIVVSFVDHGLEWAR